MNTIPDIYSGIVQLNWYYITYNALGMRACRLPGTTRCLYSQQDSTPPLYELHTLRHGVPTSLYDYHVRQHLSYRYSHR